MSHSLVGLLKQARELGGCLHLSPGRPPIVAGLGVWEELAGGPIPSDGLRRMLEESRAWGLQASPGKQRLGAPGVGLCWGWYQAEGGLFHLALQPLDCGAPPSLEALNLPAPLEALTDPQPGLSLLVGPRRCGLSTTLSALLELMRQRHLRIHVLGDGCSNPGGPGNGILIHQEADDIQDWSRAVETVLHCADLLITELTHPESALACIQAAEEGLAVIGLVRGWHVLNGLEKVLGWLPGGHWPGRFQRVLRYGYCQWLVPGEEGFLPVTEFVTNAGCRQLLQGPYPKVLERQKDCWSLHDSLKDWQRQEKISEETVAFLSERLR